MSEQQSEDRLLEQQWLEDGLRVGEWFVEPQRNRITRAGDEGEEDASLEPKVMQVFVCMARRPGKTVTKKTFMEEVWTDTVVSNDALLRCISELRSALGDDARDPDYIETIRKVGYRLIAPISYPAPERDGFSESRLPAPPGARSSSDAPKGNGAINDQSVRPDGWSDEGERGEDHEGNLQAARERIGGWVEDLRRGDKRRWGIGLAALMLLAVGALVLRGWFMPEGPALTQTVPFTSFPGEEFDSALSSDGERVAFVWNGGDESGDAGAAQRRFDIYVKQHGSSEPLRLTNTPAREHSPAWSPQEDRLAFLRATKEGTHLVIAPVLGGEERVVARFTGRRANSVVWSPQGDTLALSVQQRPYGPFRLVLFPLEAPQRRQVLTSPPAHYRGDVAPAFSPDGKTIAFARGVVDRVQDLFTISVEGEDPKRLTHDRSAISGLDWTADGRSIIFASDREGASRLWRVAARGGTPTWVATSGGGDLHQPSIAHKGVRMTLTERSLDMNIWRLHAVDGYDRLTSHRLLSSTRWESYPDVSPDGERLAFASKRSGSFEIWTSQRDGTAPARLTSFEGPFVSAPQWSSDGAQVAFSVQGEEGADVYVVNADGSGQRQLTHAAASDVAPSWSRDGRWIYFASNRSGRWQVWKRPAGNTGPAQQVTEAGGFAAQESPDGRHLYYVKRDQSGLWRQPLENDSLASDSLSTGFFDLLRDTFGGGGEERVVDAFEPTDWGNWAITERGLYYVNRSGERPALMYQSFRSLSSEEGTPVRMAYLDGLPHHPSLAVAPGARWFLHAKVERNESDILLVERFR